MKATRLDGALAKIRQHHQQHVSVNFPAPGICVSRDGDWPCDAAKLLAAVDDVLRMHTHDVIEDAKPPFHYCSRCSGHPAWPCPEVATISQRLLGGDQ